MIATVALIFAVLPSEAVQVLAGPAFERFAARTEAICPDRQFRFVTPGDLDGYQEDFVDRLPRRQRGQLQAANTSPRTCTSGHGLSCPTVTLLAAMVKVGQLDAFAAFACTDPPTVPMRYPGPKPLP